MARAPVMPADAKAQIVLGVLRGETSAAEAARRHGVSGQTISMWKKQFISGGQAALAGELRAFSDDEDELRREIERLKIALGEAHLRLRWQTHPGGAVARCGLQPSC
ncbi:transposase [Streptomyces sp. DSM 44915]|uniref:Transposase n=1 Tax=Streptomyces chisholmiae TaxID=3075540 RepID=A0ABU2JZ68_9ACTN|nr:transposase [Streptomyces sp. DSM 44915]MDT0270301.1 transposase [Streptomyces sp. DSM 44915]